MSNELRALLARVEERDPGTAKELRRHVDALQSRREFGLNFERHTPESVALTGRRISVGDKVRFIPVRGETEVESDATWTVTALKGPKAKRVAQLLDRTTDEATSRLVDDLVYVAEFLDPIYPGLRRSDEPVLRGGDKPFHTVINAENYHALEAMLFTYQGQVDCIYIDPPYNTRANDWKYNNDYVDPADSYAHSKWLAFMERRLTIAKGLLNPEDSVLIVTIDEKEYLRLGLLLEQTFPGARIQMVSVGINPAAVARNGYFGRSDEYYFFVMLGSAGVPATFLGPEWISSKGRTHTGQIRWDLLRKSGSSPSREGHPGTFYPVIVTSDLGEITEIGDPIGEGVARASFVPPAGRIALWPIRKDGSEGRWAVGPVVARNLHKSGYLRLGKGKGEQTPIYYLARGEQQKINAGVYEVTGRAEDGSVVTTVLDVNERRIVPGTQWRIPAHDSTQYGSRLLSNLMPDRKFPFPKSIYAVEDALHFFLQDKPNALVLDFFAGSGTTAHATMRLNRRDGGQRRTVSVTNNEVNDQEAVLRSKGLRPGDPGWESLGICDLITKPRIRAAVTGLTPAGDPVQGAYKFAEEFPMSEGFKENVEFFTLTYENPALVELDLAFERIAPLLWMRAGSRGRRIDDRTDTFDIADTYGVLFDIDAGADFVEAIEKSSSGLRIAYVVTDDETQFQAVASQLPEELEKVRLYESYLRTFQIITGRA